MNTRHTINVQPAAKVVEKKMSETGISLALYEMPVLMYEMPQAALFLHAAPLQGRFAAVGEIQVKKPVPAAADVRV